uniref:Uncharacterized protein n=1 Tax=Chromera velia CCMP2878 TaxID=1169474 RepID=A0A0G4G180_9ALVE|eukprot:Cvel_19661.t1-p1 / transcript=Cvel_19661.t1 / gene=Cvel_19661 / organism=Chromera_velia_CCMP2878 / gene_product=hypothetical protein / transcript_product=hypothetical protein / location=Cvel_scaffold1714:6492-7319(+) / protein_length=276 / sequence_SO=supercontig / SO=protein_coding / is_pseudo=false
MRSWKDQSTLPPPAHAGGMPRTPPPDRPAFPPPSALPPAPTLNPSPSTVPAVSTQPPTETAFSVQPLENGRAGMLRDGGGLHRPRPHERVPSSFAAVAGSPDRHFPSRGGLPVQSAETGRGRCVDSGLAVEASDLTNGNCPAAFAVPLSSIAHSREGRCQNDDVVRRGNEAGMVMGGHLFETGTEAPNVVLFPNRTERGEESSSGVPRFYESPSLPPAMHAGEGGQRETMLVSRYAQGTPSSLVPTPTPAAAPRISFRGFQASVPSHRPRPESYLD